MKDYAFGIDVGGTTVKMGLFSTDGVLLESWEIPTRKEDAGSNILPDIAAAIEKKLNEKGLEKDDIEVNITAHGVDEVIAADGKAVTVAADVPDGEVWA